MYVGFDDTDSVRGGCTTFLATDVVAGLQDAGYRLIGYPRLVRLNPNIPWKTRGNGAIALRIGIGSGEKSVIGDVSGEPIVCCSRQKGEPPIADIKSLLESAIGEHTREGAQPAYVLSPRKLPYALYRNAVRTIVSQEDVLTHLDGRAEYRLYGGGRGVVGAAAAIAWKPFDRTYELITYGDDKRLDRESVIAMDARCPTTFNNYDYRNAYVALLPKAPSPVFYGIRGDDVGELRRARELVGAAKEERWLIFETNQGTDAHLQKKELADAAPYESVIVRGTVDGEPRTIKGGHVVFSISANGHSVDCAAYEPTKEFRHVVKQLRHGDEVMVYGGVRAQPFTINLEKLKVERLADVIEKLENPVCPHCCKHMKSAGTRRGFRCVNCGARAGEEAARYVRVRRLLAPGFYEVPVIARRHLAKPLKRMRS
jgi:tRNA(Ile2)-agmatinylcytidine synthase